MRKPSVGLLSAILLMWFAAWSTSGICEETRAEAVVHLSNKKGPLIDAPSTSEDLGDRLAYGSFSHSFKFTNVGDEPLEIRIVQSSCGCIGALMSDPSLEPGGTGELIIDYKRDPKKPRIGPQDFTVLVSTNDPAYPDMTFSLKFRLVHAVEASPDQVDFGNVTTETVRKFEVKCYRDQMIPSIRSIQCESSCISLDKTEERETDYGRSYAYCLFLDPKKKVGEVNTSVLVITDAEQCPLVEIPVRGTVGCPVSVQPGALLFGIVEPNSRTTKTAKLSALSRPHEPLQAKTNDSRVLVDLETEQEGKQWVLRATLAARGIENGSEKIKTAIEVLDSNGSRLMEVPVFGVVVENALHSTAEQGTPRSMAATVPPRRAAGAPPGSPSPLPSAGMAHGPWLVGAVLLVAVGLAGVSIRKKRR